MRKRIGHHLTAQSILESVIANRTGGANCFFDVTRFYDVFDPVGVAGPNTSEKICLQLESDREPIVLAWSHAAARRLHTICNAEQILNMMPNFMCDHIGLREIASRTKAFVQ